MQMACDGRASVAIIPGRSCRRLLGLQCGTDASQHAADMINLTRILLGRMALNIDPVQVYVVGLSSGGALSLVLGCMAPDLYDGVASSRVHRWKRAVRGNGFVRHKRG